MYISLLTHSTGMYSTRYSKYCNITDEGITRSVLYWCQLCSTFHEDCQTSSMQGHSEWVMKTCLLPHCCSPLTNYQFGFSSGLVFQSYLRLGHVFKNQTFDKHFWSSLFTSRIPFPSPNLLCQSTKKWFRQISDNG